MGGNEIGAIAAFSLATTVAYLSSSHATAQPFVYITALSHYQNQNYQPPILNCIADSPVAYPDAPNVADRAELMCSWRVWISGQSVDGFRQPPAYVEVSNATDVSFRRTGYDDLVGQIPKSDLRSAHATPPCSR